jgi:acetyl esterase
MNLKLRALLWFVNNVQPIRQSADSEIPATRKKNEKVSALGKLLFNTKLPVKEIKDFSIEGIKVRLYKNSGQPNQKVIIYFHGGGFVYYDIESHDFVTRRLCVMNECTVISVDYRLAPEYTFPAAHEDAYKVIEYVYHHANELGIDQSKIIVAGDSAGGNLAACACHHFKKHKNIKIAAQILIYPWVDGKIASASIEKYKEGFLLSKDAIMWFQQKYTPEKKDRLNPEVSPIYHTDFKNLAPAFILTAEYDPLKDEGFAYAERLKEKENTVLYKDYKALVHGFFNLPKLSDESLQSYYDIQAFLKKVV